MRVNALWEHYTALSLWPRKVRSVKLSLDLYLIYSLVCRSEGGTTQHLTNRAVCVHGLGSSGAAYGTLLPELTSFWGEVWAPSAPGHGLSPHRDLTQEEIEGATEASTQHRLYLAWEHILLALSEEAPVDLIAVSLGGAVSMRFAARHPKRVKRLILCSPAGARLEEDDISHLRSVFRMSEPGDGMRFLKTLYHQPPWWSPLLAPLVRRSLSRPEAQEIINQLKPGDGLAPEELQSLSMPILLIWGDRERVLPPSSLPYLQRYAPAQLSLLTPPHFSHSPQRECPRELARVILDWVERVGDVTTP